MNQDEIIEMAIENTINGLNFNQEGLVRFAHFVAAKATEEANERANASWTLMCKKMVAIEREACAKVCDELSDKHTWEGSYADECAQAIRARGEA
jgi:4-alpha-glucanotransferase